MGKVYKRKPRKSSAKPKKVKVNLKRGEKASLSLEHDRPIVDSLSRDSIPTIAADFIDSFRYWAKSLKLRRFW